MDAGVDAVTMAWLLKEFPVGPLPQMLVPLTEAELRAYRDKLREQFKALVR